MPEERTRDEHLEWCKKRALEYVDEGNLIDAVASLPTGALYSHTHPTIGLGFLRQGD